MSYKYTKGSTVQGDIKAADDTERNTIIDFGEDQIEFQTSGSTRLKVDNNGVKVSGVNLGVRTGQGGSSDGGGNPVYTNGEADPKYTIHAIGDINNGAVFATETYADSVGASKFRFIKARGTPGSPAAVNTDDEIGRLEFYSHTGSNTFKLSAMILGTADSDGDGKLSFRATHGGSDNEAFYIHNNLARFNDQIVLGSSGMVPYANKGASLGGASSQWNQVNAATVKAFETLFVGATNQIFDQSGLGISINDDYEPHGNHSDMEALIINTKYTSSSNLVLGLVKTGSHTVGIGTAGTGNSNEKLVFFGEYSTTSFEFRNNVGTAPLGLQTSGSVLMTLSAAGNLGIGSTSPISKLDVAGKIAITAESATPSQPSDGQGYLYTKSDGKLYWRSYDVTETDLTSGGGGGGSSSNRSVYMGYVSLQTTARVVSYDLGTNLGGTANNNFKGMIIVPFDGTLDTVILSPKGADVTDANFGNITVTAYKNQSNFASGTSVVVAGDNFQRKTPEGSTNPKIYSGEFDFSLSVSAGDLIQIKANRGSGGSTDTLVTVVFTES